MTVIEPIDVDGWTRCPPWLGVLLIIGLASVFTAVVLFVLTTV